MNSKLNVVVTVYWASGKGTVHLVLTQDELDTFVQNIKLKGFTHSEVGYTVIIPCYAVEKITIEDYKGADKK